MGLVGTNTTGTTETRNEVFAWVDNDANTTNSIKETDMRDIYTTDERRTSRVVFRTSRGVIDACILGGSLEITNDAGTRPCTGGKRFSTLGNFTTSGTFEVHVGEHDANDIGILTAIEDGLTIGHSISFNNEDSLIQLYTPSMRLAADGLTFTANDIVSVSATANAFRTPVYNSTTLISCIYGDLPLD